MATLHRFDGHRVFIYSNDHRPEHVHVEKAEKQAAFLLNCPDGLVTLRENWGFTGRQLRKIARELNRIVRDLCAEWENVDANARRD
jgi:hypothetical protein